MIDYSKLTEQELLDIKNSVTFEIKKKQAAKNLCTLSDLVEQAKASLDAAAEFANQNSLDFSFDVFDKYGMGQFRYDAADGWKSSSDDC